MDYVMTPVRDQCVSVHRRLVESRFETQRMTIMKDGENERP